MSQYSCPTVAIKSEPCEGNEAGVVIINEEDFDAATMTLCDVPEAPEVLVPEAHVPEAPVVAKVVAPWAAK